MMGCQSSRPRDGVKHASMASAAGSSSSSSSRNRTMPQMSFGLGVHVGRAGNVDLSSRKMDFLGPRIIELIQQDTLHRKATSLTLTDNLLYTLGKELTLLPELEEIDMDANRFQRLPESLTHLPNLWRLNASANPLSAVTGFDMAPRLQALRALALRACSLSCVPARLAECVTLEELDLSDNAHMHVDAFDFAQLRYLRKLSVKNCGLHGDTLPRCLQASALYSLDISGNHFTFESPEFFGKVIPKTLHELHLCRMQLTSVPQAVIVLKRLYFLDLAENPIETLDVLAGRLVKRLPRVRSSASSLVNLDEDNNGNHSHNSSGHDDNNNGDNDNGDGHDAAAAAAVGRDDDNDDADSAASTGTRVSMSKVSKAGIVSTVTQPLQLRKLSLRACGLRTVPRYFHKMSSLEELDLSENDRLDDPNMTLFSLSQLRVLNITGCPFAVDPSSSKNEWFDIAKLRRLVDLQWELWRGPHNASLYRTRIPIEICGLPLERINEVALRPGLFVGDTVETAIALLRDGYYKVDFSMDDDTVLSYASALRVLLDAQDFFFPPEYTMHVMAATAATSEGGGGHAGKGLLAAKGKLLHHLHEHYAGNVHLHHAPHLAHLLHRHTQQNNNSNSNNAVTGSNDAVDAVSDGQQQQQPHDDAVTSVGADDGVASASTSPATAALQPQASGRSSGSGGNSGSGGCCTCSELGAAHLRIAVNRYIFFLAMQAANYDAVIIPPLDVMCMHLSQMTTSPLQYREDCEAICGRILNCNYRNFFIESERQPAAARDAIAASRKIWNLMVRSAQRELRWLRYDYWDKLTRIAQGASGGGGSSTTTATAAAAMATGGGSPLIAPLPRGMASLTTSAARAAYWHELCATDSSRDLAGVLDQAITSHFGERGAAQFASTLEAFYDAGRCFAAHAAELRSVRLSWARYAKYLLLYAYRLSVQSCSEGTLIAKPQADEDGKLCAPAQHPAMMAAARGTRRAVSSLALGERGRAVSSSALDLFLLDGHTLPSNSHNNNNNNNSSHQHNSSSSGSSSSNDGGVRGAVDDSAIVAGRAADASSHVTIRPHRAASALVRAPTTRAPSAWMASSAAAAAAATSTPRAAPRSKSMLLLSSMHYGASASSSSSSGKDSVAARAAAAMRACTLAPVPTLGMMLLLHVHRTSHVRYLQTLSLLGIDAVDVHWHDTKAARQQTMRAWAALYDEVYTFESRDAHNNSSSNHHTKSAAASSTSLSAAAATTTTRSRTTTTPQPPSSSSARAASGASDAARDGSVVAKPAGAVAATSSDNSNNNDNNNDNNDNDDDDEEEERPAYAATYDPHCVPRTSSRLVRRSNTSNSTKERRRVVFSEGDGRFGVF